MEDDEFGKIEKHKMIEEAAKTEAVKTEKENYKKAKAARLKLEKAADVQKGTTNEIRKATANLGVADKSGIKAYENAKHAKQQANQLISEQNAFNPLANTQAGMKGWMENNAKADASIEEIKKRLNQDSKEEEHSASTVSEINFGGKFDEEKQTNKELGKILQTVKQIDKETEIQKKEGEKEATQLKDIGKTAEYAKKEADLANKKLEKFNKEN